MTLNRVLWPDERENDHDHAESVQTSPSNRLFSQFYGPLGSGSPLRLHTSNELRLSSPSVAIYQPGIRSTVTEATRRDAEVDSAVAN